MADYKKNYNSGFINPFDSSKEFAYDRIVANIFDSVEGSLLSSVFRKKFKCVLLSGKDGGIFKATNPNFLANMPQLVDLGDGIARWKSAFTIHESLYDTAVGIEFTKMYGKSPLISGLPAHVAQSRITNMPMAYTDIDNSYHSSLHYGSIVDVIQRRGAFFIVSTEGSTISVTTTPVNTPTQNSSKNKYNKGKKLKLDLSNIPKLPPLVQKALVPEITNLKKGDFVLIFGDSQSQSSTKGGATIGRTLELSLLGRGLKVKREGNSGQRPSYYSSGAGWGKIQPQLKRKPKLIIMTLGGNGTTGAVSMIDKVKKAAPEAKTIWIGAPPPAIDGAKYKHSERFLSRKNKNTFLQKNISQKVTRWINPNEVPSFEKGYKCSKKCDGIHVPGNIAKVFLANAGLIELKK